MKKKEIEEIIKAIISIPGFKYKKYGSDICFTNLTTFGSIRFVLNTSYFLPYSMMIHPRISVQTKWDVVESILMEYFGDSSPFNHQATASYVENVENDFAGGTYTSIDEVHSALVSLNQVLNETVVSKVDCLRTLGGMYSFVENREFGFINGFYRRVLLRRLIVRGLIGDPFYIECVHSTKLYLEQEENASNREYVLDKYDDFIIFLNNKLSQDEYKLFRVNKPFSFIECD